MEIVFLLLIILATGLLLQLLVSLYRGYQEHFTGMAKVSLEDMFLFVNPRKLFYSNFAAALIAPLVVWIALDSPVPAVLTGILVMFAPRYCYRWLHDRRMQRFAEQLPDAMTMIAGSLRAGASLQMAFEMIVAEQPAPISQELGLVVREQKLGVALEESLSALERRLKSEDLSLTVSAIVIAKDVGGNLSEILDRLANTLRAKAVMEGKIRALTSQGKLQGIVVGLLPVFLAFVLFQMDPDAMHPMFHSLYGWLVVGVILVMETIGALMIKKIVTIDV